MKKALALLVVLAGLLGAQYRRWNVIAVGPLSSRPTSCSVNNDVFVCNGSGCPSNGIYYYCTAANTWTVMSVAVGAHAATHNAGQTDALSGSLAVDITGNAATATTATTASAAPWAGITDKPSSYTPSAHAASHAAGQSDALSGTLAVNVSGSAATVTSIASHASSELSDGGDLVTGASTTTFTNKTLDVEGTGNSITTVVKIWIPAVNCDGTTASLNWDTIATLKPTGACTAGTTNTGLIRGLAQFSKTEISQMQTHFMLPTDWSGGIDLKYRWQTAATSGSVVWQAATACVSDGEVNDVAWNSADAVADAAKGTTLQVNDATKTSITVTGCAAGDTFHLKIFRDPAHANDDLDDTGDLLGVEVTLRRAQ